MKTAAKETPEESMARLQATLDQHVEDLEHARDELDRHRAFLLVVRTALASHVVAFVVDGRVYFGAKAPAAVEALEGLFPSAEWPVDVDGTPYCATTIRVGSTPEMHGRRSVERLAIDERLGLHDRGDDDADA
jgi:hypothetical protein